MQYPRNRIKRNSLGLYMQDERGKEIKEDFQPSGLNNPGLGEVAKRRQGSV